MSGTPCKGQFDVSGLPLLAVTPELFLCLAVAVKFCSVYVCQLKEHNGTYRLSLSYTHNACCYIQQNRNSIIDVCIPELVEL